MWTDELAFKTIVCLQANLNKIVSDVMDIAAQLVKKNVKLVHNVDPATPIIVADKKRIIQILYNLIGNALKFTHQGTVLVDVKLALSGKDVSAQTYPTLHMRCAHTPLRFECWPLAIWIALAAQAPKNAQCISSHEIPLQHLLCNQTCPSSTCVSQVLISVTDSGCGIPPEKHKAIFEPFNQVGGPF